MQTHGYSGTKGYKCALLVPTGGQDPFTLRVGSLIAHLSPSLLSGMLFPHSGSNNCLFFLRLL